MNFIDIVASGLVAYVVVIKSINYYFKVKAQAMRDIMSVGDQAPFESQ